MVRHILQIHSGTFPYAAYNKQHAGEQIDHAVPIYRHQSLGGGGVGMGQSPDLTSSLGCSSLSKGVKT